MAEEGGRKPGFRLVLLERLFGHALFWCQQAAEKSLKGFLTWNECSFRKTHDLEELGRRVRRWTLPYLGLRPKPTC